MNIIETVQKNLGFESLKKIDPNTQETKGEEVIIGNSAIAQAGIPAVLLGIFNKLEETPSTDILVFTKGNLLESVFGKSTNTVIEQVDIYSRVKDKHSVQQLEHITSEAMRVIKQQLGDLPDESSIRDFVSKNKPDILLYLPPSLDLGTILKNNNLDDRTGKMEGPISNFIRKVETAFNTSSS